MRRTSLLLIILGILIASYPFLDRAYTMYHQNKIYEQIENSTLDEYNELDEIFKSPEEIHEVSVVNRIEDDDVINEIKVDETLNDVQLEKDEYSKEKNLEANRKYLELRVGELIGSLEIEKIDLKIPVLYGATDKNMKIGAGQIFGTSNVGDIGNVALAAHRSYTYGRFFNRLDEIEVGDRIIIQQDEKTYEYKVYQKKVVLPEDISVLNRNKTHKILTLITCTPIRVATHRLIIHAEQVNMFEN